MNAIHAGITIGVTELRESPTRILKRAEDEDQAVAILNHNKPAGYIISPRMMEAMLAQAKEQGETPASRQRQKEQDELNNLPEVQAKIAEFTRQHYRKWPEEKLPALNGKTPLQAIKTKDGKEMVEALLMGLERSGKHTNPPLDPAIIAELRERLGLV